MLPVLLAFTAVAQLEKAAAEEVPVAMEQPLQQETAEAALFTALVEADLVLITRAEIGNMGALVLAEQCASCGVFAELEEPHHSHQPMSALDILTRSKTGTLYSS